MSDTATQALAIPTASAITRLENVAEIRGTWVESKRQELALAEAAVGALATTDGIAPNSWRLRNAQNRVRLLRKVVRSLERGFIPIPRFNSRKLDLDLEELPVSAIVALKEAQAQEIFDEVRFVPGDVGASRRGRARRAARDPLLVGVVRTPAIELGEFRNVNGEWLNRIPGREEHFLVAWWRPEDERDEVMF